MKQKLFERKNNLFQSPEWLAFQEEAGHQIIEIGGDKALVLDLPFGKKFVWLQKGPNSITNYQLPTTNLPGGTVFLRIEPGEISENDVKRLGLRAVKSGSLLSGQASPKATRVLDISGAEEEIMAQMKSKTRYNIRLAEKKGVKIRETNDAEVLCDLLAKTASRDKGYAPHPKEYYQKLMSLLESKGLARIFVAEFEGRPLAAILVSFYGEVGTYLHGGFDESQRNLMAPYLCQWEAIKYAKERGCQYYDFWGVCETDDPKDSWAGISRFKEGFGGEKIVFAGDYDLVLNRFWYDAFSLMAKIKRIMR